MKTRIIITLIVALMSIILTTGCQQSDQTNNDLNYQVSEGGAKNLFTGNKHTSNGPDQPEYTYERRGGILGFFLGDVRKTNGPVSSGASKHIGRPSKSSSNTCSKCGGKKSFFHKCKSNSRSGSSSKRRLPSSL